MPQKIKIVSRRARVQIEKLENKGWTIVDITYNSGSAKYIKFSSFYPHGNIPIPGISSSHAESVEGIWQGLKVFEEYGIDGMKFTIKNMKNIKRSEKKFGKILGHSYKGGLIDYIQARNDIYLPAYNYVLDNYLKEELVCLKKIKKMVLLDYSLNEDINDITSRYSTAAIIKARLED